MAEKEKDISDNRNYSRGYIEGQRFAAKRGPASMYYAGFQQGYDDKVKSIAGEKAED